MSIFTGAGVALITPMHEDGSINYDEMERMSMTRLQMEQMLLSYAVRRGKHLQ